MINIGASPPSYPYGVSPTVAPGHTPLNDFTDAVPHLRLFVRGDASVTTAVGRIGEAGADVTRPFLRASIIHLLSRSNDEAANRRNDLEMEKSDTPSGSQQHDMINGTGQFPDQQLTDLTAERILETARQTTGLTDLSPNDFHIRLQNWIRIVNEDSRLTAFGRLRFFQTCVQFAKMRLRLNELYRRHPQIRETNISKPIIIIGSVRSGTTHLQGLLAANPQLRSLRRWEYSNPISDAPKGQERDTALPNEHQQLLKYILDRVPELASMHQTQSTDVAEDSFLQGADFASGLTQVYQPLAQTDPHELPDQTQHYAYMKNALRALQWLRGPDRWVLKDPYHCNNIGPLMSTFPDAIVVMTHRDPLAIIHSVATMASRLAPIIYDGVDINQVISQAVVRLRKLLQKMLNDRALIPQERLVDVKFHDFMNNAMNYVDEIHRIADLYIDKHSRDRLKKFHLENWREKRRFTESDLQKEFGLDTAKVRDQFDFYYRFIPVEFES